MSKSQNAAVAKHFEKPGARLTAMDALRLYGIGRLAARVPEVRAQYGLPIQSHMITVIGQRGPAKVAEYSLAVKS